MNINLYKGRNDESYTGDFFGELYVSIAIFAVGGDIIKLKEGCLCEDDEVVDVAIVHPDFLNLQCPKSIIEKVQSGRIRFCFLFALGASEREEAFRDIEGIICITNSNVHKLMESPYTFISEIFLSQKC